jgi:hypothetical protein
LLAGKTILADANALAQAGGLLIACLLKAPTVQQPCNKLAFLGSKDLPKSSGDDNFRRQKWEKH